ncbi:MAG: S-methyl-5-thioadenosine phosphorylase [Trizodia sp. TS-e1964]|nr:MAG: S-methyl-5-thioadenosine phosphorylase [Trizodia sp. TS-e1964]
MASTEEKHHHLRVGASEITGKLGSPSQQLHLVETKGLIDFIEPVYIGVIGGTGLGQLPGFTPVLQADVHTPWGMPSSPVSIFHLQQAEGSKPIPIAFISRHGPHHELAPHEVPSRANIAALRSIGVRSLIAFSAVGSLKEEVKPRDFVLPDQIIDRTKGVRPWTFFEGGLVGHVGFADPFDAGLAAVIAKCAHSLQGDDVVMHEGGTVVCMEGPQFSTRAESNIYRSWGASVINMSVLPEAKLAREAEIAYQMICMSTDYDCWRESSEAVSVQMVMGHMAANAENAKHLTSAVLQELAREEHKALVQGSHLIGQSTAALAMTGVRGRNAEAIRKLRFLFPDHSF